MACGLVLDPRQDFPAWLSTQGVNSHVAQAVEQELGIGDYEALLACAESAQVRSELFVLARERLSFATYAVLRRAIEGLASRRSDAVDVAQGLEALGLQPFLSGLLDSMVVLLTSVSQDLSHSAQRLRSLEPTLYGEVAEATSSLSQGYAVSDPGVTTGPEDMYRYDMVEEEEDESLVDQKPPANYAEECNEIGAVEQQIPEASLNEQMIEDESQTIGSIVGRSSEHLLDVHFVKREPSAVGNGAAESQGKLSAAGGASDAEWVVTEPEHRLCEPRTQYFVSREDAESRPRSNTDFAVSASWTSGPSASFPSEWRGTFWPRLQAEIENEVVEADVHEQQKREREKARRQFVCKMCLQVYSCEKYLQRHIQMHTGTRPFSCRECGRAFLHSSDLRVHMRIHTGEQPFRCQDCGRRFSRSFNLARHRKTHTSFSNTYQQNEFCK